MADVKISALPAAGTATDADEIAAVQGGTTKKVTVEEINQAGSFQDLSDTPSGLGSAYQVVSVNSLGTALTFSDALRVREEDGTPSVLPVTEIRVTNGTLTNNGSGSVSIVTGGGGGGAPTTAQYLTLATDATLTAERVLTPGDGIAGTDAGAGSTYTLDMDIDGLAGATPVASDTVAFHDAGVGPRKAAISALPVTDSDAIHDNVAGEINAITEKATPVNGDWVLIEDSADSNNKKKAQLGNLPGGGGSSTFTGLTDTPANYTGDSLKTLRVNSGETAVEFVALPIQIIERNNSGNYTTTSTTLVAVDTTNLRVSLTTTGGTVELFFEGKIDHSATAAIGFDFHIDGTTWHYNNLGFYAGAIETAAGTPSRMTNLSAMIDGLSAGAHTFDLGWRTNSGTATLNSNTGATLTSVPVIFWGREI
jgi:hypothetical protein